MPPPSRRPAFLKIVEERRHAARRISGAWPIGRWDSPVCASARRRPNPWLHPRARMIRAQAL